MDIKAEILDKFKSNKCKNKPVTYGFEGPKIGKMINSKIDNNSLIITIKINKKWRKKIDELVNSILYVTYNTQNIDNKIEVESIRFGEK